MKDKKKSQKRRILYRTSGLGRSGGESEVGRRKSVSRAQSQALELQVRIIVGHFAGENRLIGTVLYVRASFVVI